MLIIDKKYKTRNGLNVIIHNEDHYYKYPYLGNVTDDNGAIVRVASYTANGRYKMEAESDFDIIFQ